MFVYCMVFRFFCGYFVYVKGNELVVMHVVCNVGVEIVQHVLDFD